MLQEIDVRSLPERNGVCIDFISSSGFVFLVNSSCLRSWLEQDTSCPTCRTSLSDPQEPFHAQTTNLPRAPNAPVPPAEQERQVPSTTNHFFHFDGILS